MVLDWRARCEMVTPRARRASQKLEDPVERIQAKFPSSPTPSPQTTKALGIGSWKLGVDYFERGSGRIWNRISLLVVPLPPSKWNGARVAIVV